MNKSILFTFLIFISTNFAFAQNQELSIADAVLQQHRKFAAEKYVDAHWIGSTNEFSFIEDYQSLKKSNLKGDTTELTSTKEINKLLGLDEKEKFQYLYGINWVNDHEFTMIQGEKVLHFNVKSKTAKIIHTINNGENITIDNTTLNAAFTIDNNLRVSLANGEIVNATDFEDKNIVSGQSIARSEFGINGGIFWSPAGNYMAFYQKNETEVNDYPLLNIDSVPGALNTIKYPMAGQGSEKARIGIFNVRSKRTSYLKTKQVYDDYLTNLAWGPIEEYIYIAELNRDQNHMKLNKYRISDGSFVKTLFEEKNDNWVEPEHPVKFIPGKSNQFLWLSERNGFMNLYLYNTEGRMIRNLTPVNWVVQEIVGFDKSGTKVCFKGTGESPLEKNYFWADIQTGKVTRITKTQGTHDAILSTDGKFLLDQYSNINTPGISQVITTSNGRTKVLITSKNKLEDYKIGKAELIELKSSDGKTLHARMIKPSDFDENKKYPVLVYVYGGPHAQMVTNSWLAGASLWMNYFAEKGYLIFTLDNRGSANRGFAFESGIHRKVGTLELEDQMTGVEYLKSLSYVDADKMAVHGWSYGGFMTTSLMTRKAGTFKVGVAGGPVMDWKYYEVMYGERYMDRPEENEEGYKTSSPITYIDQLQGDLMLIHGTIDDVVVMQHSYDFIRNCVDQGVQIDFFAYPMHKHNIRGKDRVHLMTKVLNYVEDKLNN